MLLGTWRIWLILKIERQDGDRDLIHPRGKRGQADTVGHAAKRGADDGAGALPAGLRVVVARPVSENGNITMAMLKAAKLLQLMVVECLGSHSPCC